MARKYTVQDWSQVAANDPQVKYVNDAYKQACKAAESQYSQEEYTARRKRDMALIEAGKQRNEALKGIGVIFREETEEPEPYKLV
jgi:hypothetical protein